MRDRELRCRVDDVIAECLNIDAILDRIARQFSKTIDVSGMRADLEQWAGDLPPQGWKDRIDNLVGDRIDEHLEEIRDAVQQAISEDAPTEERGGSAS